MRDRARKDAYMREYYVKNRARIARLKKERRVSNPERFTELRRAYRVRCAAWIAEYRVKYRSKIRAIIAKAKDRPCADCRKRYPKFVMEFDHVRGKRAFTLAAAPTVKCGPAAVIKEIAKCDVVCANCHRIRTFKRLKLL